MRRAVSMTSVILLVAACGGSPSSAAPSVATASVTSVAPPVAPTTRLTTTVPGTAASGASAGKADPAADLGLGPLYQRRTIDPSLSPLMTQLETMAGAHGHSVGGRVIYRGAYLQAVMFVFGGITGDEDFESFLDDLAKTFDVVPQPTAIQGTPAWTASNDRTKAVMFRHGDRLIYIAAPPDGGDLEAIAAALVIAND